MISAPPFEGDAFMLADFEDVLDRLNVASRNDEKAMCFCPAHDDRTSPSLSIKAENGRLLLHCFAGCRLEDIVSKMGLEMKDLFVGGGGGVSILSNTPARLHAQPENPHTDGHDRRASGDARSEHGCTLKEYSEWKKLPEDFLRGLGLRDVTYLDKPTMRIPYPDEQGQEVAVRFRVSMDGTEKFRWRSGDKPLPYGLRLLEEARKAGFVALVEGESDCHTLWLYEIPAIGIPGANNWRAGWASHLDGIEKIYAFIEPDQGGDTLREKLTGCEAIRERLYLLELDEHKDPSSLHLTDSDRFREQFKVALENAKPWIELARAEAEEASREAWERCHELAEETDILERFAGELARSGVAGESRIAKLLYLAMTSRLLERPVSVALKGPSSGGKSYLVERVLSFFPKSAYYALTAMSDRTLAYSEEPIKHRFLVLYEAAGMNGDFQTYLMRSLLSEGKVRYETVEKTSEGMKPRLIEREGPTGLIVTTTAVRLHAENETRLLSLTVTDTQDQTKAVMAALAEEAGEAEANFEPWHALQIWLESAEHRVSIPYARKLAQLIPPVAVRLRRDFGAVLNLIRAHALLHQASRERDAEGRIVATLSDYAAIRDLVADLVSEGIEATVPETVRQTVEAVRRLREGSNGEPVTVTELTRELKLDRSAVSRRVRNAKDRGYLRDLEENQRKPSRLVLGDDLPDDLEILPKWEDVRASMQERASGSAHLDRPQEPHGNGQNSENAYKACNRARVQEGIKNPPPPVGSEPGEADNPQDDTFKEVRDLFAQDTAEEA
jgi:DNA-binding transcriptional ArsR family regulator